MRKTSSFIIFAFLLLTNSLSAQMETPKKPEAYKFAEFGPTNVAKIAAKMKAFDDELNGNPTAQGYIINYGSATAIKTRRRLLTDGIFYRKYDTERMTWIDGPYEKRIRTVMWIVPEGAETPIP